MCIGICTVGKKLWEQVGKCQEIADILKARFNKNLEIKKMFGKEK